jgi:hypothetical protein
VLKRNISLAVYEGSFFPLIHWWWESKLVQPLWKTIWRLLKKLNIYVPYDTAIPLLGIYPKECDSGYSRGTRSLLQHYSQ